MPIIVDFTLALNNLFRQAELERKKELLVNSGELHRVVGGYPGGNHSMPSCCSAMHNAKTDNDKILYEPPKGKGATLEIMYSLPRPIRHFVAYHKFSDWGDYLEPSEIGFSHYSNRPYKHLQKSLGQRIWVIGGQSTKAKTAYTLLSCFTPNSISPLQEGGNIVKGLGKIFDPPVDLSSKPWFPELLKEQQNFSLGINEIKNDDIIEYLLANTINYLFKAKRKSEEEPFLLPDELIPSQQSFIEGAAKTITVNRYERDSAARQACINHYGITCQACQFDFEKTYGEVGRGYIHVHHLKPLSDIKENYQVNPIKDLVPVCPNCHAMLHKEDPPMSIEKLKQILAKMAS